MLHPTRHPLLRNLGLASALILASGGAIAQSPDQATLYQMIQDLQRQVQTLQAQLAARPAATPNAATATQLREQEARIEALAQELEQTQNAQDTGAGAAKRVSIGGYGELHYNNLDGKGGATDKDEIDFHRFVLFFGHDFNDRVRFRSELEVEHALTKDNGDATCTVTDSNGDGVLQPGEVKCDRSRGAGPGEVELEQAYIDFDINSQLTARGGLFLIPVGIINETHEPPTFYGVERNPVESAIIPSTWWAGGAGLVFRPAAGWQLDAAIHEGLNTNSGAKYAVRSGRQKTALARGKDLAFTGRIKWTGYPGVELAGSYQYQSDMTQSLDPKAGSGNLFEAHAAIQRGPFGLRALYAYWDLDGQGPKDFGADKQFGFYLEPSLRFNQYVGVFTRYSLWNNQAGSGLKANDPGTTEKRQYDVGVNLWPAENVVIKADYQIQDHKDDKNQNGINLGIGYQF